MVKKITLEQYLEANVLKVEQLLEVSNFNHFLDSESTFERDRYIEWDAKLSTEPAQEPEKQDDSVAIKTIKVESYERSIFMRRKS